MSLQEWLLSNRRDPCDYNLFVFDVNENYEHENYEYDDNIVEILSGRHDTTNNINESTENTQNRLERLGERPTLMP